MGMPNDLERRVAEFEARLDAAERKAETIAAAQRTWRVVTQARGDLVLASDAGDLGRVPVAVARVLAAGRALDVSVEEEEAGVKLVDPRGRVVARLSRAAFLALPKAVNSWARESQSRGNPAGLADRRSPPTTTRSPQECVSGPGTSTTPSSP